MAPAQAARFTDAFLTSFEYTGDPGETNALNVSAEGDEVVLTDPGNSIDIAGTRCTSRSPSEIVCPSDMFPDGVSLDLGDQDDSLRASGTAVYANGGAGDDFLQGSGAGDSLSGDAGRDELRGNGGGDNLFGGAGGDRLYAGPGPTGAYGGDGADQIFAEFFGRYRSPIKCGRGSDYVRGPPRNGLNLDCERAGVGRALVVRTRGVLRGDVLVFSARCGDDPADSCRGSITYAWPGHGELATERYLVRGGDTTKLRVTTSRAFRRALESGAKVRVNGGRFGFTAKQGG